jgi:hypothetical protein
MFIEPEGPVPYSQKLAILIIDAIDNDKSIP